MRRAYTWGLDLSGSLQGAGGVGGLLSVSEQDGNIYFAGYDGNGNITTMANNEGLEKAAYEYDPFGNVIRQGGEYAGTNKWRFSTKSSDSTTGLYYYGYRWYDAYLGRWPSRDPIEEEGGVNLYGMLNNNSLNSWDYLGFTKCEEVGDIGNVEHLFVTVPSSVLKGLSFPKKIAAETTFKKTLEKVLKSVAGKVNPAAALVNQILAGSTRFLLTVDIVGVYRACECVCESDTGVRWSDVQVYNEEVLSQGIANPFDFYTLPEQKEELRSDIRIALNSAKREANLFGENFEQCNLE